jgi:hypothetical protein
MAGGAILNEESGRGPNKGQLLKKMSKDEVNSNQNQTA